MSHDRELLGNSLLEEKKNVSPLGWKPSAKVASSVGLPAVP